MTRGALVVFAKQPAPGAVKTRMVPPLDPEEAAALYECMLDDILETSAAAASALGLEPVLSVHPPLAVSELAQRAPAPFRVVAQHGRDLAERMRGAVAEAGASGSWPLIVRGSDSPALGGDRFAAAHAALGDVDLVLVPDRDGGYALVGLARFAPGLFDHAMSTPRVADETLAGAHALGLATRSLEPSFDVDRVQDLRWLAAARAAHAAHCRRTLAFLDQRDLWRHLGPAAQHAATR